MKTSIILLFVSLVSLQSACQNQASGLLPAKDRVGGGCEGCEAIYESPVALEKLSHTATLPDYSPPGTSLRISGLVFKADGKTPAPGVILYIYHTDHTGNYPVNRDEKGWGRRHGYLRGWIRTNEKGEYAFLTKKPAPYPGRRDPAHIHCIVKEPGINEYYIGDFLFDDDPLVSPETKRSTSIPGGNGVLKTEAINNRMEAKRDIYLGRNVRGYPGG
jgi:protocatechuate 3,4-dioxygenase beta subunit